MPKRHLDEADLDYYLMLFDSDGHERAEQDGSLLSTKVRELVQVGVTDVFVCSHGWKGDLPAANSQYDRWISAMAALPKDRAHAYQLDPKFKSLIIGAHWPSQPWGNESAGAALLGLDDEDEFGAEYDMSTDELVQRYAARIADTDAAQDALRTVLAAADDDAIAGKLADGKMPPELEAAYRTLFAESGLGLNGATAAPGSDQQTFAPMLTMEEWADAQQRTTTGPGLLGGGFWSDLKNVVLSPVRQMSFWAMKHRARHVGETGVHRLLADLQSAAGDRTRFHLMGHSFGCIVVTAAVAGPIEHGELTNRLSRAVTSLFLVQGAMSLWSLAESIPFPPKEPGFYRPMQLDPLLVSGPIVTTQSSFDGAVGTFFPLGAKAGHDRVLAADDLPEYGGVGTFGLHGTEPPPAPDPKLILAVDAQYIFEPRRIYNIDSSRVIRNGSGPSGAHSDIEHPEVAHLFWAAALTGIANA